VHLKKKFKTKNIGEGKVFIGLNLIRDREKGLIFVDQSHYAKEVLQIYGMAECNPAATFLLLGELLVKDSEIDLLPPGDKKIYQTLVESLGYLMNCSQPDMAYAVTKLAQFAAFPTKTHLTAAKHVLRYLKATQNVHLTLGGSVGVDEKIAIYCLHTSTHLGLTTRTSLAPHLVMCFYMAIAHFFGRAKSISQSYCHQQMLNTWQLLK